MTGHSTSYQQKGVGCPSVPTPSSTQCWPGSKQCSPPPLPSQPQPDDNSCALDTNDPGLVFRHAPNQALHLTDQLPDIIHGPSHTQAIQTGSVQADSAPQSGHANMEDAEAKEFDAPLLDFCKVLQFVCETLSRAQGDVQRAAAAGKSHFLTPPSLFRFHHQ